MEYNLYKYLEKNAIPFKITAKEYKRALMAWKRVIKNRDKVCQICGSDENLEAHLKVGQEFEGMRLMYDPNRFEDFKILSGSKNKSIDVKLSLIHI